MVRAVVQGHLDVDDREAEQRAVLHGLFDALGDRVDELLWDRAADDDVLELEACPALARLGLPSLAVDADGERAIPTPSLVVPWLTLGLIVLIAGAAGMALPIATASVRIFFSRSSGSNFWPFMIPIARSCPASSGSSQPSASSWTISFTTSKKL